MLELISLKVKNLASHLDSTFYFKNKLKVIVGINKDISPIEIKGMNNEDIISISDRPIPSIGSGKSTVIEGLNLALFAEPIRKKVTIKELISKGKNESEVELICKNNWLGLSKIRIVRNFYSSKSKASTVKIFETNSKGEETEINLLADELNNRIVNYYIGISKEDLINFFIIQKDRYTSFLLLSDSNKKEIISKFTGVDKYNYINEEIDKKVSEYNKQLVLVENNISRELGKIEIIKENVNSLPSEKDFKFSIQNKVSHYFKEIEVCESLIKEDNLKILSLKNKIKFEENLISYWTNKKNNFEIIKENNKYKVEYEKLINNIKNDNILLQLDEDFKDLNDKINKKNLDIKDINESLEVANEILKNKNVDINKFKIIIEKFKTLKKNLIECPNCHLKFNPSDLLCDKDIDKKIDIELQKSKNLENELVEVKNDIKELENLKGVLQNEIKKLDLQKIGILSNKDKRQKEIDILKSKIKTKIDRIDNIYNFILDYIIEKERGIRKINKEIQEIEYLCVLNKDKIESINKRIEEENKLDYSSIIEEKNKLNNNLLEIDKIINKYNLEKKDIEFNKSNYKDAKIVFLNFKNYIYNKMIFNIEQIVNFYLQKFSDLSVEIKGQKLLSDGKTQRDEINVIVKRNSQELNYFLMSSGEKIGIDLSFILTFQHILNTTCKSGGGLNSLELDEVLGSLDSYSLSKITKTLNSLNKSITLISHVPINLFEENIDNTYIIKENDNSIIFLQKSL